MTIQGEQIVGHTVAKGANGEVFGIEAATGARLDPAFGGATKDDLERACALAAEAFPIVAGFSPERRAGFLEAIAEEIAELGDALIERCCQESGLPRPRVEGERGRTMGQLRLFAAVLRDGGYLDARIDPALPDRKPLPRPDLRLRNVPVGPVAVFGASNFPLAFSVAGGDTASALAAGCPVVAKAHSAHPGTSELVARAVLKAAQRTGMPEGVFSLLFDSGREIGQGLVADRRIKAVGFTGSRTGGTALMRIAAGRPEPIPVYAEMSSINPVLLFPAALEARGDAIAKGFAASLTLGAGQFCTNPGLVLAIEGEALDRFTAAAAEALAQMPAAVMLTPGIHKAYEAGVAQLEGHASVQTVARGQDGGSLRGQAGLFSVSAADFLAHHELQDEVFGAASLVVRCRDEGELREVVDALEGQLTVALHIDEADHDAARALLPALETKAGRILVNGFGTGVEVAHAMVHGGPYPATADGRTTSVGSKAIERFLRPVCYQDLPASLLPDALQDGNPLGLWRREDGRMTAPRA